MKSLLERSLSLLRRRNVKLNYKQVPEVQNSIRILKEECFANGSKRIIPRSIKRFEKLVILRSWHYPVQYLCSSWPFRELHLKLVKPVLIPRFQSQYMVQVLASRIMQKYNTAQISKLNFVEYGCGSGALGLSLIKELNMKGTLIDIKDYCIALTKRNAIKNNLHQEGLTLIQDDMMNRLNYVLDFDIVVSNPPYLSKEHYQKYLKAQIKKYEDKDALVTDHNGMKYIEALIQIWQRRTKKGIMMIEFDGRILDGQLSWVDPFVIKDQYDERRFILLEK